MTMITKRKDHSDVHSDNDLTDFLQLEDTTTNTRTKPKHIVSSPLYKQTWFWAILLVVGMAAALLTTDSTLVRQSPKAANGSTNKLDVVNNSKTIASSNDGKSSNKKGTSSSQPKTSAAKEKAAMEPSVKRNAPPKAANPPKPAPTSPKQTNKPKTTGDKPKTKGDTTSKPKAAVVAVSTTTTPATFPFRYRGPKVNDTAKAQLAKKWGTWQHIQDDKTRPSLPCHAYDHCDVPRAKFPANAWQTDEVFLKQFLTQAKALVTRAQEAILAEYGQSKFDLPDKTFLERSHNFQLDVLQLQKGGTVHPPDAKKVSIDNGGWTTSRSFKGLVRRVLHAIVTQDNFTFALGGHSIAAGHG